MVIAAHGPDPGNTCAGSSAGLKKKRDDKPFSTSEAGLPVFREAVPAIDRSSLGRLERYFAFLTAV